MEIAETLNSFFLNQKNHLNPQSELKNDLHCQPKQAPPPTPYQVSGTLNLPHISKERVVDLLLSVPLHKATSDNGVTVKLLRIAAPAIINDLPLADLPLVDIYADDTTLSFSSDVTDGLLGITSALQQDLDDLSEVGRQQDGHKCCQEEMSLSDLETPYK